MIEPEGSRRLELAVEVADVLDGHGCDAAVACIEAVGQEPGEVVHEDGTDPLVDPGVRRARQTAIPRTGSTRWLYDTVWTAIEACNEERFGFDLDGFDGPLAIVDYGVGDHYQWHLDLGRAAPARKLSVSVLLSDPGGYEGGGLAFPGLEFQRVARGAAIMFPSYLLHGVQPVRRGRRVALVAWAGGPPFR